MCEPHPAVHRGISPIMYYSIYRNAQINIRGWLGGGCVSLPLFCCFVSSGRPYGETSMGGTNESPARLDTQSDLIRLAQIILPHPHPRVYLLANKKSRAFVAFRPLLSCSSTQFLLTYICIVSRRLPTALLCVWCFLYLELHHKPQARGFAF